MPPKGWKKGSQPKVTGTTPAPQVKVEKKGPKMRAARAIIPDAVVKEAGSPGYTSPPISISERIHILNSTLLTFASAVSAQNLSADAATALNEEIVATIDAIADLRDELLPPKISMATPEIVIPQPAPEPVQAPTKAKPPKNQAAPAQVTPPMPMPFPAPPGAHGIQQPPMQGFIPVVAR